MTSVRGVKCRRSVQAVPFISLLLPPPASISPPRYRRTYSPSRLLQPSGMLSAGDTANCYDPFKPAQIGQTSWLSLYMFFSSHSHRQDVSAKDLTWKDVMYKCRANLQRVPLFYGQEEGETTGDTNIRAQNKVQEHCYELSLVEDLNDGRVHDSDNGPYEDVLRSGLRTRIPVHQIAKMFYTTSGKLMPRSDMQTRIAAPLWLEVMSQNVTLVKAYGL